MARIVIQIDGIDVSEVSTARTVARDEAADGPGSSSFLVEGAAINAGPAPAGPGGAAIGAADSASVSAATDAGRAPAGAETHDHAG